MNFMGRLQSDAPVSASNLVPAPAFHGNAHLQYPICPVFGWKPKESVQEQNDANDPLTDDGQISWDIPSLTCSHLSVRPLRPFIILHSGEFGHRSTIGASLMVLNYG